MRDLLALGEAPGFDRLRGMVREVPDLHGLGVQYDDLWVLLAAVREAVGERAFHLIDGAMAGRLHSDGDLGAALRAVPVLLRWRRPEPDLSDLAWAPQTWQVWCDVTARTSPIPLEVEVLLRPDGALEPWVREQVDALGAELPASLRIARRDVAVAHGRPRGQAVWQHGRDSGTLGGLLDVDGLTMATTAAHVAAVGSPVLGSARTGTATVTIGDCVHSAGAAGWFTDETALVHVTDPTVVHTSGSPVVGISTRTSLPRNQALRLTGATARRDDVVAYQWIAARDIVIDGATATLDDGIEVRRPRPGSLMQWRRASRPGDSGAWITRAAWDGTRWCGTVVGGDSVSTVVTWAQATLAVIEALPLAGGRPVQPL